MLIIFIKYTAMILCSLYICLKLLRINPIIDFSISFLPFILVMLPAIYLMKKYAAPFNIFFMVILFAFCLIIVLHTPFKLSITTSVISFGIAYFLLLIATIIISPIGYFLDLFVSKYISDLVAVICISVIQLLLCSIPFKLRRFHNGMPFLFEAGSSDIGAYISVSLLLAVSFLSIGRGTNLIFTIPFFFTILCGLTIFFWWKSSITRKYLDSIKAREIKELQKTIEERNLQIEQLKHHNDELSKIIHKDNKLIPAMEYAVREYLTTTEHAPTTSSALSKGQELLDQLAGLTKERTGILANYESQNKKLASTNIPSIDTLLSYMSSKAQEYGINFDVTLSGSISQLTKQSMEESDLRTLLADLIENAIIATKKASSRNILINLGFSNSCYSIDIFDSGELFKAETLSKIGVKRTTTHAKEGGSGIGLMTVLELIKKCQASFIIEELSDSQLFTKMVSVCFDQLGEVRIKTSKQVINKSLSSQANIIQNSSQRYFCSLKQCDSLYTPAEHP
jgi:signal transduction histidine kinase